MIHRLDLWHKTKQGKFCFGLAELVLAYIIGSLAINNGSLLFYAATFILLYGGLHNFIKLAHLHNSTHDKTTRSKKTA